MFCSSNKLLTSSINQHSFTDFISSIDNKFSHALQSSQSLFGSTEQRLDSSIREIKASTETQINYLKELILKLLIMKFFILILRFYFLVKKLC